MVDWFKKDTWQRMVGCGEEPDRERLVWTLVSVGLEQDRVPIDGS
jgi:hypothetical protein